MVESVKNENVQSENHEVSHETTLYAEPIFHIGKFTVNNSLINSWLAVFILVVFFILLFKKVKNPPAGGPKGIQNIFEILLEEALKLADSITGNRKKSENFLPICLALFLFILINNWLGLIPGVGTIGFIETHEGHQVFVPMLRGATADFNTTLALAILAVVISHFMGTIFVGSWHYLNKFLNIKALLAIPKKIGSDFTIVLVNPIKVFVGIVEIIGEIAKIASLSLRLFGNIFAGEVLLASMMMIFAYVVPIPFIFLEIIVGTIQAVIFSILTLVFLSISTTKEEH